MFKILRLAMREYKAAVKTKGFIIGLIVAPIVMGGGGVAYWLLKDNVDIADKPLAIIDKSGLIAEELVKAAEQRNENEIFDKETGKQIKPFYKLYIVEPDTIDSKKQMLELSNQVRNGSLYAILEIGPGVLHPSTNQETFKISYYAKNPAMDNMRNWLNWPINNMLRKLRLEHAGVKEEDVKDLFYWVNVDAMNLVTLDESTGNVEEALQASPVEAIIIPIVMMFLMFLMIMMSVPAMLNSVMEEKTQRIAEVLLSSVRPFEFMIGKVVGGIAVSLTSSMVYIIGAIVVVFYMGFDRFIPFHVLPWFLIYMLLAVIMFGAFAAALGSTCSEAKDAQSLTFPMLLPALLPMFIYLPVAKEPMSVFSTWTSLIPTFTPTLMILRMATPEAIPVWQPYLGLIGVFVFTLLMVWLGGRIFRIAILLQGTPPKLANIVRWAFKG